MDITDNRIMRVLTFYDIKGWAWWNRINNIARNQPEDIVIDSLNIRRDFNHKQYDFIMVFDSFLTDIILRVPREKLILGCSCPKKINAFLKDLTRYQPLAGFVNNKEMYDFSKNHYKMFYCPNGVDEDLFRPEMYKPANLTACWVGNSEHFVNKGLEQIKQACEKAEITLLTYDLSENKILLPHIDLRNKIYYRANFYICFSECEGTPNPALEALSCGLPVITTRVGNMPEIIVNGFNGYFIDRNEASLFDAIHILKNSDLRKMSVNSRNSILNGWTWRNHSRNYTKMLRILKMKI